MFNRYSLAGQEVNDAERWDHSSRGLMTDLQGIDETSDFASYPSHPSGATLKPRVVMFGNTYYRVVSSFVAVTNPERSRGTFATVPTGAIIETESDLEEPGLIEIRIRNQSLWAFARDIQERSERLVEVAR
ncbi:MAG TPA: hypothetical protein VEV37_04060 [Bryobacteraceae bacterium]|nr:hypothetical protein [Bryobacteraceae bacterium]